MDSTKYPIKIVLRKFQEMVYFSQLDLTRLLERALRRSSLPIVFTQGFNPHVKISFSHALKLGVEGKIEVTFYFWRPVEFTELKQYLSPQLPDGLELSALV